MKKFFLSCIAIFISIKLSALSFSCSNLYLDAFVGCNFVNGWEEYETKIDVDIGYAVGLAVGYRFMRCFAFEIEGAFRDNSFNKISIETMGATACGKIRKAVAMANLIGNLPFCVKYCRPYVGLGAGARWDWESLCLDSDGASEGDFFFDSIEGIHYGIIYQGILGVAFWQCGQLEAAFEYRYLDAKSVQGNHTLDLKARWNF